MESLEEVVNIVRMVHSKEFHPFPVPSLEERTGT